ncbi:peptidoglycan D,D-transpeptidase FtsI family protein [Haloimpatiens sp. FM7330]|uniref:peptidoglycan D,D-transpeptidase FtsI family protein n=1 Tax=Haloimpatiens sp. FM7330 TaxID=3298610 RepID=UPI003628A76C
MKDISGNIKKVMFIFLIFFVGVIVYITYFEIFVGPKIVNRQDNQRLWAKRNAILRGTIYDKNMKPIAQSKRVEENKQKREYLYGSLFAHAIGYENEKYGLTGLENKYDKELMALNSVDFSSVFNLTKSKNEKRGYDLVTTLDYNLQKKAFDFLGDKKGAVVALNPKTGEILAMVSKPTFNPNKIEEQWSEITKNKDVPLLNRAVSGMYPPGSIFKTVTAVSALENIDNIMTRNFKDRGKLVFNKSESLSNYNGEVLGNVNFEKAYVHSSNVVFGSLGIELGNDKLKKTAEKFYFNKDIPSDGITIDNSKFPQYKDYEKGNIAQSAIGQSAVLATPIQMALVASTIANNGVMMKPMLVNKVVDHNKKIIKEVKSSEISRVTSEENAEIMKKFMRKVVTSGTGRAANVWNVKICGKTGTADHKDNKNGKSRPHSWFIGFGPYEDPKIAVAVIVEEGGQGGGTAARIASKIIQQAVH